MKNILFLLFISSSAFSQEMGLDYGLTYLNQITPNEMAVDLNLPKTEKVKHKYVNTWNKEKTIGLSILAFGGLVDGIVEGYGFDGRTSFERKYGWSPYSWAGSFSWTKVYNGRKHENGFKSSLHKWAGAFDLYHTADRLRWLTYISGGITIGIGGAKSNKKPLHYLADFGLGLLVSASAKSLGMKWVRK